MVAWRWLGGGTFTRLTRGPKCFGGRASRLSLAVPSDNRSHGGAGRAGSEVLVVVLLYAFHNAVSAVAAVGAGQAGDKYRKMSVLAIGLGVLTNMLLAGGSTNLYVPVVAIVVKRTWGTRW